MPVEIPGFYFDSEKNKYFKIERPQTSRPAASYSSEAVKRRRVDDAAAREEAARREVTRHHVRRRKGMGGGDMYLPAGLLGREIGGGGGESVAAAWSDGLVDMGRVQVGEKRGDGVNLGCFWVGSIAEDLGALYTAADGITIASSYVPTDDTGRIRFRHDAHPTSGRTPGWHVSPGWRDMSSVEYHAPSNRVLMTSSWVFSDCTVAVIEPMLAEPPAAPWDLASSTARLGVHFLRGGHREWAVHGNRPAPAAASNRMCALATNHGVVLVDKQGSLFPVVADVAAADTKKHKHKHKMQGDTSPREMFDVDWGHPDLLLAGGRAAKIWTMDLRAPERQWSSIRHVSSVAKLRAVGAHQVVACGPRNAMALYDVRYTTARQHSQSMSDGPLLTFPEYKNEAQLHVGFDVWPEAVGGVPPVVAAAHDDGTVGVYSLSSGRKLPCRALDAAAAAGGRRQINAGTGAAAAVEPRPVRALRFADFPVDGSPSLWVGQGMDVVKYTLGRGDDEE